MDLVDLHVYFAMHVSILLWRYSVNKSNKYLYLWVCLYEFAKFLPNYTFKIDTGNLCITISDNEC